MVSIDPTPNPESAARRRASRHLRIAALLLVATVGVGAAARLRAHAPDPVIVDDLSRTFTAPSKGPVQFRGALEGTAVLPNRDRNARMELVIRADAASSEAALRMPTDLVVVLDRSGSMAGDKIQNARAAVRTLIGALGDGDRFALVTYADGADVRIPLGAAAKRSDWFAITDAIRPDGGTNMASGLDAALAMIDRSRRSGRAPRVVLISDGLANQGDASREGLVARASRAARGEYTLSTVGVGADFDEGLMAALADSGTGNFHFLANASGLERILSAEFATARETVASALRVAIEPTPGIEVVDAAGYPLAHEAKVVTFQPGSLFAGQERRIWVTLRVPADATGIVSLGSFSLDYGLGGERHRLRFTENPRIAATADEDRYFESLDVASFERSVVVDQYNALRRSVAAAAKDGRERDAVVEIQKYRADVARKNEKVKSPQVAAQLEEAAQLEDHMEAAAAGEVKLEQMELKQLRALGYVEGRPGSRK